MERWSTSESLEWCTVWSTTILSIREPRLVGDMSGVIGATDHESFLATGWKTLRPSLERGVRRWVRRLSEGLEHGGVGKTGGWRPLAHVGLGGVGVCCKLRATYCLGERPGDDDSGDARLRSGTAGT